MLEYNTPFAGAVHFRCVAGPPMWCSGSRTIYLLIPRSGERGLSLVPPGGLAVDASGNLYIADTATTACSNTTPRLRTGTTADMVFGQGGSFTSGTANEGGVSANSLCFPDWGCGGRQRQSLRRRRTQQPRAGIRHPAYVRHHRQYGVRAGRQLHFEYAQPWRAERETAYRDPRGCGGLPAATST